MTDIWSYFVVVLVILAFFGFIFGIGYGKDWMVGAAIVAALLSIPFALLHHTPTASERCVKAGHLWIPDNAPLVVHGHNVLLENGSCTIELQP